MLPLLGPQDPLNHSSPGRGSSRGVHGLHDNTTTTIIMVEPGTLLGKRIDVLFRPNRRSFSFTLTASFPAGVLWGP